MDAAFGYADACGGNFFRQAECGFEIDFEGPQIAAVDADQVAAGIERALQFGSSCASHKTSRPCARAIPASATSSFWSRAATISRMASAQFARASTIWNSSTMKSLRRQGRELRPRLGADSRASPEKTVRRSTPTARPRPLLEIAREFGGFEIGANQPFEGEAFFSSAITATAIPSCALRGAAGREIRAECAPRPRVPALAGRSRAGFAKRAGA
jgi:hypothetical protein